MIDFDSLHLFFSYLIEETKLLWVDPFLDYPKNH